MHDDTRAFLEECLTKDLIEGARVLNVGCKFDFWTKKACEDLGVLTYDGMDIEDGQDVTIIADICLYPQYPPYDVVICTNTLEHIEDWRNAVHAMKVLTKVGGHLLISVPSSDGPGNIKGYHGYPSDYWRFSGEDLAGMVLDMEIIRYTHTHRNMATSSICAKRLAGIKYCYNFEPQVVARVS